MSTGPIVPVPPPAGTALPATTATGPARPAPLTFTQCNEALWKVIGRFDTYIGSTNTKAAFLIAFNTFVLGGVVLKWMDIKAAIGESHPQAFAGVAVFLLVAMGAALVSLWFTFQAISPFLASPNRPNEYHSNLFFGDVCSHATPDKYLEAVSKWDEAALQKDLAYQAHTLAGGLNGKFAAIKNAIRAVLWVQLPAMVLAAAIALGVIVAGVLDKATR